MLLVIPVKKESDRVFDYIKIFILLLVIPWKKERELVSFSDLNYYLFYTREKRKETARNNNSEIIL